MFLPLFPTSLPFLLNQMFSPFSLSIFSKSISPFLGLLCSHGPSCHCLTNNYFHFFCSFVLLSHMLIKPHPCINLIIQLLQGDEHS